MGQEESSYLRLELVAPAGLVYEGDVEMVVLPAVTGEVGVLPRPHGSALFTRGQTQVLSVTTLGPIRENQILDGLGIKESKEYIHHYNFPPYSVGETRMLRGPSRREIGHGALAERSLARILPSAEEFPYTIRIVSELMSSNGSSTKSQYFQTRSV